MVVMVGRLKKCPVCKKYFKARGMSNHMKKHNREGNLTSQMPEHPSMTDYPTTYKQVEDFLMIESQLKRKASIYKEVLLVLCREMITILESEHEF